MLFSPGTEHPCATMSMRRRIRLLAKIAAAVCLLVVLLLLALHTGAARRYALDRVKAALASQHIDLQAEALRYNLFTLSVDARNLRLRSSSSDLPPFATIATARLDLSLTDLLRKRYVVQASVVDDVSIHYVVDAEGRDNLPRPPRDPAAPQQPLDYLITRLLVPKARFRYEDRARHVDIELAAASIQVTGNSLTRRHQIRLEGGDGRVQIRSHSDTIDRVSGLLDFDHDDVKFEDVTVAGAGAHVAIDGAIRGASAPEIAMKLQATVDAARASVFFDLPDPVNGTVSVEAAARGRASAPVIDAHVFGSNVHFRSLYVSDANIRATYDVAARHADVPSVRVQAPWGRVTASGALALDRHGRSEIHAHVRALDAAAVMRELKLPYVAATRVDGKVEATWPGLDYADVSGTSVATLSPNVAHAARRSVPIGGQLVAQAKQGTIVAQLEPITVAGAKLTGQVKVGADRRLEGQVRGDAADVASIASTIETLLGRAPGSLLPTPIAGAAHVVAQLGGTIDAPTAAANVAASSLSVGTASGVEVGADLTVTPTTMTIAGGRAKWNTAQAGVTGTIGLKGSHPLDLALEADAVDMRDLIRTEQVPVSGTFTASGRIRGTIAKPVANVTVKGAGLTAFGEELGSLIADAALAGRDVTLSRFVIDKPQPDGNGRITAAGTYHLDRESYTLDVQSENVRLLGLTLPGGQTMRGNVLLSAKSTGTVSSPAAAVTLVLDDLEVQDRALGKVAVIGNTLKRDATITLTADRFNLTADAVVTLARPWPMDITVRADALDLETLPLGLPGLQGIASLNGSLRGTPTSVTPDLTLTVDNGAFSSAELTPGASNVQVRARVVDGAATIERLTAIWGSATVEATGVVPLDVLPTLPVEIPRNGGPATIKASIRNLDPATIPRVPAGLSGHLDLDVDAATSRADLAALEGHITVPRLELVFNRLTLTQKEPAKISIRSGAAIVERLALAGSGGEIAASGSVGLAGERPLDVKIDGTLNVAALSAFTEAIRADGTATLKLAARGTMGKPQLDGTFDLADTTIASDALDIVATNVVANVALVGQRIELTKLAGNVNGGTLQGAGTVTLGDGTISDIDLRISAKDFAYDAPLDLRSLSDATVQVHRRQEEVLVAGQVTIKEAGLTSDINFDKGLFGAIGAPRTLDLTETRDPFLERVRFSLDVDTASPVIVDNNLAQAEIDVDLRIAGTPYDPGLTGRLTLAQGGQVTLNARRYEVERGIITFVDERRIAPSIDLLLNTEASNYDVRISVSGTPGKTETSWTSEPPLSEPDIMALVVTGRTVDEMRGEESEVARVQALSYLTGRVGSKFGRGLEKATGISEVRIEPVLIANETDPTARLTVGQDITDQLKLIYSTNLTDSNDQIWVAEYDVTRRFQLRGVSEQEDDSYRGDFRHDLRFGGDPAPRRQVSRRPTIARLSVTPDAGIDEATLRKLFTLKEGDEYDFFAARTGIERIEDRLIASGYLQSRVRLDREVSNDVASLTLRVTSGPLVTLHFEGVTPPSKIQRQVGAAWNRGVFDKQRGNDGIRALREWLIDEKYLQSRVEYAVQDEAARRRAVFRIDRGARSNKVVLAFDGASGITPSHLDKIVEEQKLERQLFTDPAVVTELLQHYYQEQGYLSAEVGVPRYEFQGTTARVVIHVREGPRFQVRHITITGNTLFSSQEIVPKLAIVSATPFVSAAADHSLNRLRDLYWPKGYNDMRSEYALVVDRDAASVDVDFTIAEGRQSVVAEIAVNGNRKTTERMVRGQVELAPSQPLDLAVLARSRRNLYGTGAFSMADITREEIGDGTGEQKNVRLNVSVREVQPVQLRYGLSYDTEGGLGGILDFSVHNAIGRARVFGVQGRYDSEIHEARLYVSQPSLRTWPRKTTASIYFREDLEPPTEQTDPFDIRRQGASIQQEMHFRKSYIWSYGYRYELATTLEPSLGVGVTETVRVTPLTGTLTHETRDEVLDASKGTFLSQAFAYSPSWLGSDRPYMKYYGQYFMYFPLQPEKPKPFTNEVLRARLVFATGVRVGLARGLGGDVPTSERFYAGGSTTMRGFEQNAVGPVGVNNIPAGGNAVIIFNNELRVPLLRRLDGVLFLDVGNVYPTIPDVSLSDLRESGGVGLRFRTPWVLLRTDYGFVLDPRPGERRSRFYFSIGQAF